MDPHRSSSALFDVFLRLRPSAATDRERFLDVDSRDDGPATHITIKPPATDARKRAIERFAFTRVFEEHTGQRDVFEITGVPALVAGALGLPGCEGRDGCVATLGVTGSGKSHTILGSRSQRGLTQLTLAVLFRHAEPYLANVDGSASVFSSLCQADVSEAHLLPAQQFLDGIYYGDGGPSRGTTPALVRDSPLPSLPVPGAFPSFRNNESSYSRQNCPALHDRLYPSLAKYQAADSQSGCRVAVSPRTPKRRPISCSTHITQSIVKLTPSTQEASFLSTATTKRHIPRVSALPTYPPIEEVSIDVDSTAEYAIVISMYEVYNDRIFDLLTASSLSAKTPQKRRALLFKSTEASPSRKLVAGLRKVICSNLDEALLVLETGLHERRVAGTGSNAVSSRSHGFFCVEIKKRRRGRIPGSWSSSMLTLVDLAGSERARAAKTAGATLAEAGKINESLMYLGQCMQMQFENTNAATPNLVPYRQCKLTELLFSNSFAAHGCGHKAPQKAVMIVTADPLGDFNATSQILRYSALAREVTVPRIPSVTSTILVGAPGKATASGRSTPTSLQGELDAALAEITRLHEELDIATLLFREETARRQAAEASWKAAEGRLDEVEAAVREEVWREMEARHMHEQRQWRAARDAEREAVDEHWDRKVEVLLQGWEEDGKENVEPGGDGANAHGTKFSELENENARLKEQVAWMEREPEAQRSPSKKMRVLRTRKWEGSGMGLDDDLCT